MTGLKTNEPAGFDDREEESAQLSRPTDSRPCGYEIRIKDHLDVCWCEWFEGWTITNLENGEVLLTSACADQPELHGALIKIRDLNLPLISVKRIDLEGK